VYHYGTLENVEEIALVEIVKISLSKISGAKKKDLQKFSVKQRG
jgi:hypothetical protein